MRGISFVSQSHIFARAATCQFAGLGGVFERNRTLS